ncbi:predicted protein [Postia placenta Mad-698-R]|uniref:Uncharacterized protein n=1 Tax=Postia placenta MAD-698-R-SB12 TaxID=670580 RepID=A0A1X6MTB7_9APHY|nr:hypothetical protein POSPLADRAFT_1071159 [Postia placenta MAD-698-R-SB12]EED79279.1 predicted protein [Postia placenta Mad-698-R]OSX59607.1 hypothetical protein POSPLADRAFT_1071159 [Postia placenta MAD-698-R-SB12]
MQAVDGPVLELSDIMHPMSPSPAPQLPPPAESAGLPNVDISSNYTAFHRQADSSVVQFGGDSVLRMQSPEPLDDSEVEAMRSRLHQLGLADPGGTPSSATLTEKELAEMPSPSQLASQAETIAVLTVQRSFLLQEKEDLHARWEADRDAWERSAEALIGRQRAVTDAAEKDYESERIIARLKDDNSALRHKISDLHSRISVLETELIRLRPLLLMQPAILQDPSLLQDPIFVQHFGLPAEQAGTKKRRTKKERERDRIKKERDTTSVPVPPPPETDIDMDAEGDIDTEVDPTATGGALYGLAQIPQEHALSNDVSEPQTDSQGHHAFHRPDVGSNAISSLGHGTLISRPSVSKVDEKPSKKTKDKRGRGKAADSRTPLLSDARAECLLIAARKIGRARGEMMAAQARELQIQEGERRKREEEAQAAERAALDAHGRERQRSQQAQGAWPYPWDGGMQGLSSHPAYAGQRVTPPLVSTPADGPIAHRSTGTTVSQVHPSHLHPTVHAPSTPRHLHAQTTHPGPVAPYAIPHPGLVYMHSAVPVAGSSTHLMAGPSLGGSMITTVAPGWPIPTTPTRNHQEQAAQSHTPVRKGQLSAPTTPMDSLVSAARRMLDEDYDGDGDGDASVVGKRTSLRRTATVPAPDSPAPKRRRTGASALSGAASTSALGTRARKTKSGAQPPQNKKGKGKQKIPTEEEQTKNSEIARVQVPGLMRVRSALDVLADQAAQEQERRPSLGPGSQRQSMEPERRQGLDRSRTTSLHEQNVQQEGPSHLASSSIQKSTDTTLSIPALPALEDAKLPKRRHPSAPPITSSALGRSRSWERHRTSLESVQEERAPAETSPFIPLSHSRAVRAASEEPSQNRRIKTSTSAGAGAGITSVSVAREVEDGKTDRPIDKVSIDVDEPQSGDSLPEPVVVHDTVPIGADSAMQ